MSDGMLDGHPLVVAAEAVAAEVLAPAATVVEGMALLPSSIDLANRAAQAWVTASGGGAMDRSHPAQRLLREAAFYLVQAQTPSLRELTLDRLCAAGN